MVQTHQFENEPITFRLIHSVRCLSGLLPYHLLQVCFLPHEIVFSSLQFWYDSGKYYHFLFPVTKFVSGGYFICFFFLFLMAKNDFMGSFLCNVIDGGFKGQLLRNALAKRCWGMCFSLSVRWRCVNDKVQRTSKRIGHQHKQPAIWSSNIWHNLRCSHAIDSPIARYDRTLKKATMATSLACKNKQKWKIHLFPIKNKQVRK